MSVARRKIASAWVLTGLASGIGLALFSSGGAIAKSAPVKNNPPAKKSPDVFKDAQDREYSIRFTMAKANGKLPTIALGQENAPVTIVYYLSLTCKTCAAQKGDLQTLKSNYIDAGKVRLVFKEYPTEFKSIAAALITRCIAAGNADKYFDTVGIMLGEQDNVIADPLKALTRIALQSGLAQGQVDACLKDQAQLTDLQTDKNFADQFLQPSADAPTYYTNYALIRSIDFAELDRQIKSPRKGS